MDDWTLRLVRDIDRIALSFGAAESTEALAGCVRDAIAQLARADYVGIYLLDPKTQSLRPYVALGFDATSDELGIGQLSGWVFETGRMMHVPDVERSDADDSTVGVDPAVRSVLYLPVRSHVRTIGCLSLGRGVADAFDELQVSSLSFVAKLAGIAYENIVLVDALRQKQQVLADQVEELRRAQSELRMTRFAIDRATDGVYFIREDGSFAFVNEAAALRLGYSPSELLALRVSNVDADPPTLEKFPALWERLRSVRHELLTSRQRTRGGEVFPVEIDLDFFEYEGTEYLFAFVRDVTERQRLQAQLSQADRMASVGLLAAGVAHEINNPLTYALFNTEDLERRLREASDAGAGADVATTRELGSRARDALDGVRRACVIVSDLKSFSRVERDERGPVDVAHVLRIALRVAAPQLRYRARVTTRLDEVPAVLGNEGRLSQVFVNLLVNAAHAIDESSGGGEIDVRAWSDGNEVHAEVRDNGHGIESRHLERLFEPFFTTKPPGVGAGLGLWVCNDIVRSIGGRMQVESEVGRGARFAVHLPIAGTRDAVAGRATFGSVPREPAAARPAARILVVDDEPRVAESLRLLLSPPHDVTLAAGGEQARALIEQGAELDVIVSDLMMPGVSGIDLHDWLHERGSPLAARMIFMTGGAFTRRAREFLERTENPRLEKPFAPEELDALIASLIGS